MGTQQKTCRMAAKNTARRFCLGGRVSYTRGVTINVAIEKGEEGKNGS